MILFYFLREGITIDSLNIARFQVQGLYLKLDKKLVVNVQYLRIPKSKKNVDFSQLETVLDRIKILPKFFQYISLDRVDFTDNQYRIIYRDNVIYLSSDAYEVAGMLARRGKLIEAEIPVLNIKKYNLHLNGLLQYDYRRDIVKMDGNYTLAGLSGAFHLILTGEQARFHLDSQPIRSLDRLAKVFHADAETAEWLTERISAHAYRLHSLDGTIRIDDRGLHPDTLHLSGRAVVQGARVRFEDTLAPVILGRTEVVLKQNVLYFAPDSPTYAKRSLKGSSLYLTNIFGSKPSRLHLKLKTDTRLDATVDQVLKAYGISLPFRQKTGTTQAAVILDLIVHSGAANIRGTIAPGKGTFVAGTIPMEIRGGKVLFDNHTVSLQALDADTGWLRVRISGEMKLDARRATLHADLIRLRLGERNDPFLQMKNRKKVPIRIEWNKGWKAALPTYKTAITGSGKGFTLVCSDIRPLVPYLKGLPFVPAKGSVRVKTRDTEHYRFSGKLTWPESYLYDKQGSITVYPFFGTYNGASVSIAALNKRIRYDSAQKLLQMNRLYIDGKKALSFTEKSTYKRGRIHIKGRNSLIRYGKYVLLTDRFDLRINGKNTTFVATKDGDTVRVELNGDAIVVKARRIKAPMLRALIHFGGLSGGRYSLDLHGNLKGTLRGVITVEGGVVSSFKTYNNMIALFNTVPALSTLSDPGFSSKGFEVRTGRIKFRIVKNQTYFDMIYVDGKSAAISGKGTVSNVSGAIDMDLAVRTARGIGKLIGSLPIVGYILMGKDKSVTTGVKVTGTLDNPKVTTHVVLETLLSPFEMFVRTLKSPAHIINK